jgi:hypothetical protein
LVGQLKNTNLKRNPDNTVNFGFDNYFSNCILLIVALLLYNYNKYYVSFLYKQTRFCLSLYAFGYVLAGLFYYCLAQKKIRHESHGYLVIKLLYRFFQNAKDSRKQFKDLPDHPIYKITAEEKNALLFVLVKLFYVPLMLNFVFGNFFSVKKIVLQEPFLNIVNHISVANFNNTIYPLLFSLFMLVDTLIFAFGYMFEANFLNNKVRSVEPTILGWIVTVLCYPPFNSVTSYYLNWYANDYPLLGNEYLTLLLRLTLLSLFGIYVWASLALGTKASNLTNRGIVKKGPYSFVRHPAYISKNLAWWISMIPVINLVAIFNMLVWSSLYFLRAITEERHLLKDPEYQAYCKNVRYRFIPHVF